MTVQGPVKEQQPDGLSHRGADKEGDTVTCTFSPNKHPKSPKSIWEERLQGGHGRAVDYQLSIINLLDELMD